MTSRWNKSVGISIHALREEGDTRAAATGSTEPISIHALREEGDKLSAKGGKRQCDFYPRPPRGGRRPTVMPEAGA